MACGFHDQLAAAATHQQPVYLQYFNGLRQLCQESTTLRTVTRDRAGYAQLASGEEVRLDRIIRLDDTAAPGYANYPDFRGGG